MPLDSSLLAFAGLSLLLAVTPGPDMATVTKNGLAYGRRGVVLTALGIATALLETSAILFTAVKLAGAAYLAYLGVRALWASRRLHSEPSDGLPRARAAHIYRQGLLSAGLNPKLGVFFVTLLPQFVEPGQSVLPRMLLLGLIFSCIGVSWMTAYGLLVTRARDLVGSPRVRAWMERVTGAVLVSFAARLALERL